MSATLTRSPVVDTTPAAKITIKAKPRLEAIDLLRGVAMVVMALDHTRDYFFSAQFEPNDLRYTTPALFFTRWVTHFCAPVFIFFAGTSVYLAARRGKSRPELAQFLLTRGVWLIILELTLLRFGMVFSLDYHWVSLTVLWAIGWSMIALAALIYLPLPVVGAFGVVMVFSHNLLDTFEFAGPKWLQMVWTMLHGPPETFHTKVGLATHFMYPLIPWVGVMAAGYAFGRVMELSRPNRRKLFLVLGLGLSALFVVIRALNVYGDPEPWTWQATPLYTLMSFLNCAKYPPSLLFLLMTLGPALTLLAWLDRDWEPGGFDTWLITYGRVPMFYFLLHWYIVHALAVVAGLVTGQPVAWMFQVPPFEAPDSYGHSLPFVYAMWLTVVIGVYPACRWFAELKRRRKDLWWLSYF